jgi:hypothetical protein
MSTRTHEFNVGQICRLAYREASLLSVYQDMTAQQSSAAVDFLELIVHSVEAEGLFARSIEFETVTLADGDDDYNLSVNTLDVTGTAMYIPPGQTMVELPVEPMSREQWQEIGVRDVEAPPTRYYVHRTATVLELRLWPTPGASENLGTIRLQSHRLRADVSDTAATPDFERYWADYLVEKLAAKLARSNALGLDRVQELEGMAARALAKCRGKSNEGTPQQLVIRHGRRC